MGNKNYTPNEIAKIMNEHSRYQWRFNHIESINLEKPQIEIIKQIKIVNEEYKKLLNDYQKNFPKDIDNALDDNWSIKKKIERQIKRNLEYLADTLDGYLESDNLINTNYIQ